MTPVLVEKERPAPPKLKAVNYRGPIDLVADIDRAAKARDLSRNEAITQLLRFALDAEFGRKPLKKR